MKKQGSRIIICMASILFALANIVRAEDDFLFTQFLETPLFVLAAILIIDIIVFIVRKLKR